MGAHPAQAYRRQSECVRKIKIRDLRHERIDKRHVCRGPFGARALGDVRNAELKGLESVFDELSPLRRIVLLRLPDQTLVLISAPLEDTEDKKEALRSFIDLGKQHITLAAGVVAVTAG
jgi:hypothetical protein